MRYFSALILLSALLVAGCGYKLGEIRPTPMRSVRSLAVPTFKNRTYEPRVEALFADSLTKRLQQDGTYQITYEDKADAVVECTIIQLERAAMRSVDNNVLATSEFRLRARADFVVRDRVTGAILMQGQAWGDTSFFSGNDLQTIERQAISLAAANLAEDITTRLTEGF